MESDTPGGAASPPHHILGYTIRSRTRIYVYYLIPFILELGVYITQIVADSAVSYQHFHSHQPGFGWATLSLILVPPVLTFVFVLTSKDQWANPRNANRCKFVGSQLLQMLFFPLVAIYRISVRIFWSAEALFNDDDDAERMRCLAKAEECSNCELYRLIQAYGQSAPQIILQLYHMLSQDLFRDYETTHVQAVSLVFSALDLAAITTTYQRFESQRQVGRVYPWAPPQEVQAQRRKLEQNERLRQECEQKKRDSERTIVSFPESDKIMANFNLRNNLVRKSYSAPETHVVHVHSEDEVDNDAIAPKDNHAHDAKDNDSLELKDSLELRETTVLLHSELRRSPTTTQNATDDDKIRIPKLRFRSIREEMCDVDEIEILDTVPNSPAPLPPPLRLNTHGASGGPQLRTQVSQNSEATSTSTGTRHKRASKTFGQLETLRNMLIMDAQLYIKERMPHPPKMLIKHIEEQEQQEQRDTQQPATTQEMMLRTPLTPQDAVDFFLPRPTKVVNGIQQDDFAGKTVAFFGWIAYLVMRMLSLSTFCVFYLDAFFIVLGVQYVVTLAALFLETRFKGGLNRMLFYMLLAYVYLFVVLEFRIKFKHIRVWYVGYFLLIMAENITMTTIWYSKQDFESWWFGFIFRGIIYSGVLFVATILVYYCILRPKDVTLIVEDDDDDNKTTS